MMSVKATVQAGPWLVFYVEKVIPFVVETLGNGFLHFKGRCAFLLRGVDGGPVPMKYSVAHFLNGGKK
jgi:hypothetical protein